MQYPKPIMRATEMEKKLGFPREYLLRAFRTHGQTFARKINPTAPNSPIIFDTEGFEKWRVQDGRYVR